jgi:hypothetical protein
LNFHAIPPVRQGAQRNAPSLTLGPEDEEFIMNSCAAPKQMIRKMQRARRSTRPQHPAHRGMSARLGRGCFANPEQSAASPATVSGYVESYFLSVNFATFSPQGGGSGADCTRLSVGRHVLLTGSRGP